MQKSPQPPPPAMAIQWKIFRLDLSISCNFQQLWFSWQKRSPSSSQWKFLDWIYAFHATLVQLAEKPTSPSSQTMKICLDLIYPFHAISSNFGSAGSPPPQTVKIFRLDLSISCNFQQLWFRWQKSPPSAFHEIPSSHHTCRIPMHPILQIHTLIPPIWISSLGYQLCQLFKILTYIEVQDTGSWCRWKTCSQPYHNTH